jgi:hypothetical protein
MFCNVAQPASRATTVAALVCPTRRDITEAVGFAYICLCCKKIFYGPDQIPLNPPKFLTFPVSYVLIVRQPEHGRRISARKIGGFLPHQNQKVSSVRL